MIILLSLVLILNMKQNSTDVIIKTENLINAVQNEPSIWNINSSEEEEELAWTRIAGVLQYSKSKLILIFQRMSCYVICPEAVELSVIGNVH